MGKTCVSTKQCERHRTAEAAKNERETDEVRDILHILDKRVEEVSVQIANLSARLEASFKWQEGVEKRLSHLEKMETQVRAIWWLLTGGGAAIAAAFAAVAHFAKMG